MAQSEAITRPELADKWNSVNQPGYGWVFYRFPGTVEINFIGGQVFGSAIDEMAGNGFLISPYYHPENILWCIENTLHFQLADNGLHDLDMKLPFYFSGAKMKIAATKVEYEKLVDDIIAEIKKGFMQKTVPARAKHVKLIAGFSPFKLYNALLAAYPNAFVYILSTPQTGTWIGCTPEKLLEAKGNAINTVSLAGTMNAHDEGNKGFSQKELDEQAIVTRYIRNVFKKYCMEIKMEGPDIIRAGNVVHLATYIKGVLMPGFENKHMQILNDLHPTPAVCGMPLQASRDFLLQYENLDRSLYSGFLGPVNESTAD